MYKDYGLMSKAGLESFKKGWMSIVGAENFKKFSASAFFFSIKKIIKSRKNF